MTRMIDDYLLAASRAEGAEGMCYDAINGLYAHQNKLSIRSEEGELKINSFWDGCKRVSILCLESIIAWPVIAVALAVEMVVGGLWLFIHKDDYYESGLRFRTFGKQHAAGVVGALCATAYYSVGEIGALVRYSLNIIGALYASATEPKEEERA